MIMSRRRTLYRILVSFLAFILLVILAAFLLQHTLNDKIRELFIRELNKNLTAEVDVSKVKFSLISDFPYASIRLQGVTMKEAINLPRKGVLMKAGTISLRFALTDLLKNKFTVTNVLIRDAKFNMQSYRDGTDNYHFWKAGTGSGGESFTIDLQRISVLNSRITYKDISTGQDLRFMISGAVLRGHFADEHYELDAAGDLRVEQFMISETSYLHDRDASLHLSVRVNQPEDLYTVSKGELQLNDLKLSLTGWIRDRKDARALNLKISTAEASLDELVSAVPARYLESIDAYRFNGRASVNVLLNGAFGGTHIPAVSATLNLSEGDIERKGSAIGLEQAAMVLAYHSGQDMQSEKFSVKGLQAKFGNGSLHGDLEMQGAGFGDIRLKMNASLDLKDLYAFLKTDTLTGLEGQLSLNGHFEGRLSNPGRPDPEELSRCKLGGTMSISNGRIGLKGIRLPLTAIRANAVFSNNDVQLNQLAFQYGKSDFSGKGRIGNLMAWLLVKNQKLRIEGSVSSDRTDWDEIAGSSEGGGEAGFALPQDIVIPLLQVNLRNFTFGKFTAENGMAEVRLNNRILTASNILMRSMKGVVSGQGSLNASTPGNVLIQCKARFSKVNLKSLFYEFGNFGNTDLTSENLDGTITADVVYASGMNPGFEIDLSSVKAHADIRVDNGRLVNYEPMKGLSGFLRVEDLTDIRFETLQNQIDIANRIIYIPSMEIKSSAIDLSLMGTHTFSNELNYHFSLALADLLAAKFNKRNPGYQTQSEFGPVEDDGRGKTRIFVSMTGTVDQPVFEYDKKAVREKIAGDLKRQKTELKEVFRKEFGAKGDSLRKSKTEQEKAIRKQQEEGKFVIEWDEK